MENIFIGICGLIGSGKTSLATSLGEVLNLPVFYEEVIENDYLDDFYKDMGKYSFPLQIYLLNKRFKQHQQIIWQGKGGVQDRTIYEDTIFAKMLMEDGKMDERDYKTYLDLFNNMANFMRKPNIIIFLDVKPEQSLERIKMRARNMESSIKIEYLEKLAKAYENFIKDISKVIPVIRVNWDQFGMGLGAAQTDFEQVCSKSFYTAEKMAAIIKEEYEKLSIVHNVKW